MKDTARGSSSEASHLLEEYEISQADLEKIRAYGKIIIPKLPDYVTAFPFAATDAIRNKMSMFTYNATATQWKGMIDAAAEKGFSKFYVHHKLTTGFVTLPPWFEDMVDYIAAMNGGGEVQGQGQGLALGQGTTAAASPTGPSRLVSRHSLPSTRKTWARRVNWPPCISASAAMGVRQEPSRAANRARSAATQWAVSR